MKWELLLLMGILSTSTATELPLWNGDMPGRGADQPETTTSGPGNNVLLIHNVSVPSLSFFPAPDNGTPNPIVIVCPGGGYGVLAYDLEGTEVAEWLNSIGVSAAILKYRVPKNRAGALQDAQRSVQLVREKATEWNIDPKRVGMLGFSAGGHLTASCSNSANRPDFTVLVYPAYLFKEGGVVLVDEIKVDEKTPPAFIVQAQDDLPYYRSSLAYSVALDAKGVPVELHLFAKGGHGYGLRPSARPVSGWPKLCERWMVEMGFLDDQ
ncbi:MAG: alpha/beta hydrolase [Kiritimatiellales bacterium]|nr:alpha/beta hydrolase [Kiritimatiellales bacterium]